MADERYRIRLKTVAEARRRRRADPEEAEEAGKPGPPSGLSRRALFGLAGAGIVAGLGFELWPRSHHGVLSAPSLPVPAGQAVGPEYLAATLKTQAAPARAMPSPGQPWSICSGSGAGGLTDLDLVLAVDTTGSMGGVLTDVKLNLTQLVSTLRGVGAGVRVGIVAYKDLCDREVVSPLPLQLLDDAGFATVTAFIASLSASGGCDWPEKMDLALATATAMAWRSDVPASIVVIADAPAHPEDEQTVLATAAAFRDKLPGALVSLVDTGSGGHPFMQALPKSGGGQYVTYDGHILKSLYPAITGCPSA